MKLAAKGSVSAGSISRSWAEIDLSAVAQNVRSVKRWVGSNCQIAAVVKADAYGHGSCPVSRAALNAGAAWLAVAGVNEAIALREDGITAPIMALSPIGRWEVESLLEHNVTPVTGDEDLLKALGSAARNAKRQAEFHLKIDTGMGRAGVLPEDAAILLQSLKQFMTDNSAAGLKLTGLATHFASPDRAAATKRQFTRFQQVAGLIAGQYPGEKLTLHCSSSAAILSYPKMHLDMVRPGLLIYGIAPFQEAGNYLHLKAALSLYTRIAVVRRLPAGTRLSYGGTHRLTRDSRIALIPVGYGDGYPRRLSNRGWALANGVQVPVVGRVCMDLTLMDVTDCPSAKAGDKVTLIGSGGLNASGGAVEITAAEIAKMIRTTPHEITTCLTSRVERVYREGQ